MSQHFSFSTQKIADLFESSVAARAEFELKVIGVYCNSTNEPTRSALVMQRCTQQDLFLHG
jgi:hypothetical protein